MGFLNHSKFFSTKMVSKMLKNMLTLSRNDSPLLLPWVLDMDPNQYCKKFLLICIVVQYRVLIFQLQTSINEACKSHLKIKSWNNRKRQLFFQHFGLWSAKNGCHWVNSCLYTWPVIQNQNYFPFRERRCCIEKKPFWQRPSHKGPFCQKQMKPRFSLCFTWDVLINFNSQSFFC